tara:strand:+ start:490 stop:681 length:192 start_codon:yes stop_codon:yes gene_type:complete
MNYKEILEGLENIHCAASEVEQEIKPYKLESEGLDKMFDDLFGIIETVREPLFDLVHSGKIDK